MTNKKQAKAILLSEARDEGYDIPDTPKRGKKPKRGRSSTPDT